MGTSNIINDKIIKKLNQKSIIHNKYLRSHSDHIFSPLKILKFDDIYSLNILISMHKYCIKDFLLHLKPCVYTINGSKPDKITRKSCK